MPFVYGSDPMVVEKMYAANDFMITFGHSAKGTSGPHNLFSQALCSKCLTVYCVNVFIERLA